MGWAYDWAMGSTVNVQFSSFNIWRAARSGLQDPTGWSGLSRPIDFTIQFHFNVEHSNFKIHCPPNSQDSRSIPFEHPTEFHFSDLSILLSLETGCDYKLKHVLRQTR